MHGAIHPLPQYAFMAWCSVKKTAQGQLSNNSFPTYKSYETECCSITMRNNKSDIAMGIFSACTETLQIGCPRMNAGLINIYVYH
jgi:hypothetical protein